MHSLDTQRRNNLTSPRNSRSRDCDWVSKVWRMRSFVFSGSGLEKNLSRDSSRDHLGRLKPKCEMLHRCCTRPTTTNTKHEQYNHHHQHGQRSTYSILFNIFFKPKRPRAIVTAFWYSKDWQSSQLTGIGRSVENSHFTSLLQLQALRTLNHDSDSHYIIKSKSNSRSSSSGKVRTPSRKS